MKHKIILAILAAVMSLPAYSGPARKGPVYLMQPDGTSFSAIIMGDEFMKTVMTSDGSSIIQDGEGWWCYAYYDAEGMKFSSGYRIGSDVPSDIAGRSRNIPYEKLSANAGAARAAVQPEDEPIMARIMKKRGIGTKTGNKETTTKHGLIILAQFRDAGFTHTREDFVKMLTQTGYSRNGATGSAKEYFDTQFNGTFQFSFDVSSIVTLPYNTAYYGANDSDGSDKAPEKMIIDACNLADDEIDFSLYDDDADGIVDNVFVFFAGGDEAEGTGEDHIWSHSWYIYSGAGEILSLDGKIIDRYACTSELSRRYTTATDYRDVLTGIGSFCHEYFHTFGLPDMYDTDYDGSDGISGALWSSTSLMDAGCYNNYGNTPPYLNAIEREYLGISEPVVIEENGGYTLEPISRSGRSYRLNTDHDNEYFLLECRAEEGWDAHIGGNGMLVYHIDKSSRNAGYSESFGLNTTARQRWLSYNEVNSRPDHQCADLIEADRRQDSFSANENNSLTASQSNIRSIFFPYGDVNSLSSDSRPGLEFWSGEKGDVSITNIRRTGEGISFNVIGFGGTEMPPSVQSAKADVFTDAAIILFESDREYEGEASVTWGKTGQETEKVSIKPYAPGKYSLTLEGLQPDNKTYTAKIHFELNGIVGEEESVSFMTKKSPVVSWPFIHMNGVSRNSDGTLPPGSKLPLRVYNAEDAAEIYWEFNGKTVTTGGDGYFTADRSGTLKAHVIREDGSEDIIVKEIVIGKEERE